MLELNMEPLAQMEVAERRRPDSASTVSDTRKKINFYIEIGVLVMLTLLMVMSALRTGMTAEHNGQGGDINKVLGMIQHLMNAMNAMPVAAALTWGNSTSS